MLWISCCRASKTPWKGTASHSRLGSIFDEILQESSVEAAPQLSATSACIVQTYLSEPNIQHSHTPPLYWQAKQPRLATLVCTAAKFLCAPSTKVKSERLFSTASIIVDERGSRLIAEKAEMLLSLKKNLPLMLKWSKKRVVKKKTTFHCKCIFMLSIKRQF